MFRNTVHPSECVDESRRRVVLLSDMLLKTSEGGAADTLALRGRMELVMQDGTHGEVNLVPCALPAHTAGTATRPHE